MNITKIVVGYQETANLGDYSNCRPSLSVEVALTEGDDPDASLAAAQALVRRAVQREVDDALEAHDKPPRYTEEPRYALFSRHQKRSDGLPDVVVLGPVDASYPGLSRSYKGFRLPTIRRLAARNYDEARLIDTLAEPEALAPVLAQIAAEDALLEAERERKRLEQEQRYQEMQRRYAEQAAQSDAADDDDDDEGDD